MVNDKFVFNPVQDSRYVYLGMRATSNAVWVSTLNNKVAEYILNLANSQKLWPIIHEIAEYLDICAKVKISFEFHNKIASMDKIECYTKSKWIDMLKKRANELEEQNTYRKDSIKRLTERDYEELAMFLKNTFPIRNSKQLDFIIEETSNREEIDIVQGKYRLIKLLRDFEFVKNISLSLMKNDEWFSFDEG